MGRNAGLAEEMAMVHQHTVSLTPWHGLSLPERTKLVRAMENVLLVSMRVVPLGEE